MVMNDVTWLSVVDPQQRVAGVVGMTEVIDGYRQTLWSSLRRLASVAKETVLVEETVADGSPLIGTTLSEATWPAGSMVVSIQRGSHLLFPEGNTVLEPGDVVSTLSRPERVEEVRSRLRGSGVAERESDDKAPDGPDMI
jgi:NhaP-type Na+/H+ and K+/H+ antiporter